MPRRAAQAKIHIHHLVNSFVSAFRTGEYVSARWRYTFYSNVYNMYVSAGWTYTFQKCIICINVYLVSRYMYAFYRKLYHTICCGQLGMHISGTPPHSLSIACMTVYVCPMPILASGICFVYSSRHLVCITARHTAFGDICQQHRESSFLLIFYIIILYGYYIYCPIIYFIHYILLISVNNIGNRAFSWFPADFYAVSCHARCRFGWGMGCWQLYSIKHCQRHNGPEGWVHIKSSTQILIKLQFRYLN